MAILLVSIPVSGFALAAADQELSFQRVKNAVVVSQGERVIEMINDVPKDLPLATAYRLKQFGKGASWTGKEVAIDLQFGLPLRQITEITEITYSYQDGRFIPKLKEPQRSDRPEWFITMLILISMPVFLLFSIFCETLKSIMLCGATTCAVFGYVLISGLSFLGEQATVSGLTFLMEVLGVALVARLLVFLYVKYGRRPDSSREEIQPMSS
ncbi:TPA: hypothetical protein DDZ49_01015 [Candidatus Wolfebacteria bacterium]|nr:MAG: hypothetical protein UX70_C0001G0684 [Candidatus Wolfebacteria bacterium GW2011_GWB1_47_1]HAL24779.1 hypothetical protein [Candidatus Wolfebacteria bacterium]HBD18343.1 hypothetical protein [Candidatus Wolfebacteria bacterium]HBN86737.1 hypothetical protein [Candidatus Wolfebacteria bacterium]HBT75148.1 hypothetical protein [Candidatus Wolfebacteria bacterium]